MTQAGKVIYLTSRVASARSSVVSARSVVGLELFEFSPQFLPVSYFRVPMGLERGCA